MYVQEKQRSMELLPLPCPQRQNLQKQQPVRLRFLVRKYSFLGKVPGASGYRVYRRTGNSDWERIAEVKSNVSSYQDSQIRGITSYTYSVRAYRNVDGKKVFGSYKESRAVLSYPDIQKISAVKKTSSGLKLYWRAQSRATFYDVYRKTKNSTWKK